MFGKLFAKLLNLVSTFLHQSPKSTLILKYFLFRVKGERIRLDQILEDRFKPATYNATFVGKL